MHQVNFGKNIVIRPQHFFLPENKAEVLDVLRRHPSSRFRVIGRLHSWSQILDAEDVLLDLRHLSQVVTEVKGDERLAHIGAGCQIKKVLSELSTQRGWTLPSVGFVTEQSIAGATATGTHGSGKNSLSHYIVSARVACFDSASGEPMIREISAGDELQAIRCSLGCLGIVLSVTVQCRENYRIEEVFQRYSSVEDVLAEEENFPLQQFYLVPWNWDYIAQHRRETASHNSLFKALYHWYRFLVFDLAMHFLILLLVRVLNSASGVKFLFRKLIPLCVIKNWKVTGPASEQLVMEHELFRHVEIELFVQRSMLPDALRVVVQILEAADQGVFIANGTSTEQQRLNSRYTHHYPICIRRIKSDKTLVSMACPSKQKDIGSPASYEDWFSISLINYQSEIARVAFQQVAESLAETLQDQFGGRVHWGKLNPLSVSRVREQYPAFASFAAIREKIDPNKQFCNDWLTKLFEGGAG